MKLEEGVEEITIDDSKCQMLREGYGNSEIIIPTSLKKIRVNDFKSVDCFVFENYKEQGEEFIINFVNLAYKVLEEKLLKVCGAMITIILKEDLEEIKLDLPPYPVPIPGVYFENIKKLKNGKKETIKEIEKIFEKEKVYKK